MEVERKPALIAAGVIFAFGVLMGNKTASDHTEFVKIPGAEHTVTKTETVTKYTVPDSCINLAHITSQLINKEGKLQATAETQHDIISDARIAIQMQSPDLTSVENRQYRLDNKQADLMDAAETLQESFSAYKKECNEALAN